MPDRSSVHAVIEPSVGRELPRILVIEHEADAHLDGFAPLLDAVAEVLVLRPETNGDPLPDRMAGFDGLLVLGGRMGPGDDADAGWLPATRDLITECVSSGVPYLGVCLGSQLLTHAAGGRVEQMAGGPEIGVGRIRHTDAAALDPVFAGVTAEPVVMQWHWLESSALPAGSVLLAENDHCAHQAFRVGERAWGVQFHPEAFASTGAGWVGTEVAQLRELGLSPAGVLSEIQAERPALQTYGEQLASGWLRVVHARRG